MASCFACGCHGLPQSLRELRIWKFLPLCGDLDNTQILALSRQVIGMALALVRTTQHNQPRLIFFEDILAPAFCYLLSSPSTTQPVATRFPSVIPHHTHTQ